MAGQRKLEVTGQRSGACIVFETETPLCYWTSTTKLECPCRYLLARLKTLCEEAIRTSITVETVCTIFLLAHKHNAEGLKV